MEYPAAARAAAGRNQEDEVEEDESELLIDCVVAARVEVVRRQWEPRDEEATDTLRWNAAAERCQMRVPVAGIILTVPTKPFRSEMCTLTTSCDDRQHESSDRDVGWSCPSRCDMSDS